MAQLDAATRQRLEQLRATDTIGVYASDEPTEGTDRTGALTVTIDPTLRVVGTEALHIDGLRTPAELGAAVASAYRAAITARLRRDAPDQPRGARPVPVATPVRPDIRKDELLNRHYIFEATREQRRARRPASGVVTGRSRNDCVWVTLSPASAMGTVDADPGWLAQTTGSLLASALTEAFEDAYSERDR